MSEETAADAAPEAVETPAEAQASETPTPAPEGTTEAAEQPKPTALDRRIAQLTARLASEADRAAKAQRELDALKAMMASKDAGEQPQPQQRDIQAEIDRAAEMKVAQREMARATQNWLKAGHAEFPDFDAKSGVLASLGATEKPAFLEAVVSLPNGHRLVPMLADDPDEAMRVLDLPPLRMAAELGRLAEKASAAPKPKAVSKAPAPVDPVNGRARREPSLDDPDLPMEDYIRLREKQIKERRSR